MYRHNDSNPEPSKFPFKRPRYTVKGLTEIYNKIRPRTVQHIADDIKMMSKNQFVYLMRPFHILSKLTPKTFKLSLDQSKK